METRGWVLFESVVPETELPEIRWAAIASVEDCGRLQVESGVGSKPDGTAHHAVGRYPALDRFLARRYLDRYLSRYFGGAPYILHAFNPGTVAPGTSSYLHRIHRDIRTHTGAFRMMINMLVMVDAFTLENGATHVLSGSHRAPIQPDEDRFRRHSERVVGRAGSIVLFNSHLWHAAGQNLADTTRVALTLSFSRPFVKQQMDYPRFLGDEYGRSLTPGMRQLLGYDAMVPNSYAEFYRPAAQRLYKADQG